MIDLFTFSKSLKIKQHIPIELSAEEVAARGSRRPAAGISMV
jgi:hypothetical protein